MGRRGTVGQAAPRPWIKYYRCKVCNNLMAANNNDKREVRLYRRHGVVVCPWCRDRAVHLYLLAKQLAEGELPLEKLQKKARKLLASDKTECKKWRQGH